MFPPDGAYAVAIKINRMQRDISLINFSFDNFKFD